MLGALLGLVHALFAGTALVNVLLPLVHPRMGTGFDDASTTPLLEPPGFLLLNYGARRRSSMIAVHVVYGAIVGGFVAWRVSRRSRSRRAARRPASTRASRAGAGRS